MNIKGADRNDTISYSQVIFNPHPANNGTHFFVEVVTVNGKIVSMTPNHLLPLCNGGLVTARSFEEGHCVMTQNVEAGGVYTAVSENEFLVVDGVVVSPFALSHGIAHFLFDREDVNEWCEDNHPPRAGRQGCGDPGCDLAPPPSFRGRRHDRVRGPHEDAFRELQGRGRGLRHERLRLRELQEHPWWRQDAAVDAPLRLRVEYPFTHSHSRSRV